MKDFSPELVSMWLLRLLACVQAKLHCLQAKGFSPLWTRMWHFRWDGWVFALAATLKFLSLMLKHVRFQVFVHLEGEIALNTWNFHSLFSVQGLVNQRTRLGGNWRQWRVYPITMWNHNSKSESDIIIRLLEKLTLMALHACFWPSP